MEILTTILTTTSIMSREEIIQIITENIYPNGNNEITANVLNPVLDAMVNQINDITGNLDDLASTDTSNLVNAINSVITQFEGIDSNSVKLRSGIDNPNVTPPGEYNTADFYIQEDTEGNPLDLWQFNGIEWTKQNSQPDGFTQLGTLSKTGNTINVGIGYAWIINDILESNTFAQEFIIENESTGQSRIDIIVTDGNQFALIQGDSSAGEGSAAQPQIPVGSLLLTSINIYEDNISEPTQPIDGDFIRLTGTEENNPVTGNIIGSEVFDKEGNENAFAQIGDVQKAVDGISSDLKYPIYIDMALLGKTNGYGASQRVINSVTRVDDFNITVPPADISDFDDSDKFFPLVVYDGTNYKMFTAVITDKPTGAINIRQPLTTTINSISTFYVDGQHLSRYGYRSLAEYIADSIERFSYRKNVVKKIYSQNCDTYEQNWIDSVTSNVVIEVEKFPGTPSGGFLIPGELPFQIEMSSNDSSEQSAQLFKKAYAIYQNVAGHGGKFKGFTNDSEGFLKIVLGEVLPYNVGELHISIIDQNEDEFFVTDLSGTLQELIVEIPYTVLSYEVHITCKSSVITTWKISSFEHFRSREDLENTIINKPFNVAFLCDSWGSFPLATGEETLPLRPDGTQADGMQFISEHLKDYMSSKGIEVQTFNSSFGGRTSAWARYWLDRLVLNLPTKPTHCVIDFAINDANSEAAAISNSDSVYDFSPTEPYILQVKSEGGIKGSVTKEEWLNNMNIIIQRLLDNNIQPIILHNPKLDGVSFTIIDYNVAMLNSNQGDISNEKLNTSGSNVIRGSSFDIVAEKVRNIGGIALSNVDGMDSLSSNIKYILAQHTNNFLYKFDENALRDFENMSESNVVTPNATASNHAVAFGQVQTDIAIVSDLTVALVVPNLRKYYGLTGVGAVASLPPIAGNVGKTITVMNKSDASQSIFSNDSVSDDIFSGTGAVNTVVLGKFTAQTFFNDGVHWSVIN